MEVSATNMVGMKEDGAERETPSIGGSGNSEIPLSLRRMLKLKPNDHGNSVTQTVERSALFAKLDAFLPKMEAANRALQGEDQVKKDSFPAPVGVSSGTGCYISKDGSDVEKESDEDQTPVIHMDVYVDKAMGQLVPSTYASEKQNVLIEVIEENKKE